MLACPECGSTNVVPFEVDEAEVGCLCCDCDAEFGAPRIELPDSVMRSAVIWDAPEVVVDLVITASGPLMLVEQDGAPAFRWEVPGWCRLADVETLLTDVAALIFAVMSGNRHELAALGIVAVHPDGMVEARDGSLAPVATVAFMESVRSLRTKVEWLRGEC